MARTPKLIKNEIELEGMALRPDERIRIKCPSCGGGSSHEESLSITKTETGDLFWVCFRDACKIKGGSNQASHAAAVKKVAEKKSKKEQSAQKFLSKRLEEVPDNILQLAKNKYGLNFRFNLEEWLANPALLTFVKWTTDYSTQPEEDKNADKIGRLAIPIFDPFFVMWGYDLKDITKEQTPKSLIIKKPEYTGGAWARVESIPTDFCIIVEDTISAMVVKQVLGIDAVALLGTTMSEETAEQINDAGYKKVLIALDNDAIKTAVKVVASGVINNAVLLPLSKDIKDMTKAERETLLKEIHDV